jgi:hypothetical protein
MVMAAYLAEARPAVPDHHWPDLFEQGLDCSGLTAGRQGDQVSGTGRLTRRPIPFYLVFCLPCHGQRPDGASLGHEGIMPRGATLNIMETATERSH